MRRWLGRLLVAGLVLAVVGASALAILYRMYVVDRPGEHLKETHIRALIAQESSVFYRDGRTPIGVFFSEEHRVYVPYEDIPEAWVQAITSAEDQRFFEHGGVDWLGFARAMGQNLKAGEMVSGGSTLTMQTAENLFYPGTRSLRGKLMEVVDTYRLEAHYSKEEILEFYANQFHVYGNGRGLGIAARYFFDKEVGELDLQESAFLAGLVKIPGRYNPFIGATEEARAAARQKAQTRVTYVLGRMLADGHISRTQFETYSERPIPFRKGEFRYDRSILLDEVERQLEAAPFPELLARAGIESPATAGLRIITTLDADAQRAATYGLWHHLSELGPALEGLEARALLADPSRAPKPDLNAPPVPRTFRHARVVEQVEGEVVLDLGGFEGRLDRAAIDRAAGILAAAAAGDRDARPTKALREGLLSLLSADAVLWVSVRQRQGERWLCDVELRPALQGAVLALEEGRVRAMVGGNDNRNFNRALRAQRQLGSTWKVLVYYAALQLGWSPTDALDNRRGVFPFSGTWYYPRPDHASEDFVSIAWAGVRSENLATIWLLYHLLDRLNPEQVRRLAEAVDLAPRAGEDRGAYVRRVRDEHGVIATSDRLEEALFGAIKEEVIADLSFSGHPEDAMEVRSMHHGRGFARQQAEVRKKLGGAERSVRLEALAHNLLDLEAALPACEAAVTRLAEGGEGEGLSAALASGRLRVSCGRAPEGWTPAPALLAGLEERPELDPDPLLDGRVHASTVKALRRALDARVARAEGLDPYDPELLYLHPDFRQLLALRYVAGLAQQLGVRAELPPVLSMPLGAVDISLAEAASIYQGFQRGEAWRHPGEGFEPSAVPGVQSSFPVAEPDHGQPLLIDEIRDRDGNLLYKASPRAARVADPEAALLTQDILRNVVLHGTGRRASGLIEGVELGGKTGTTNSFKNAAFIGYVAGDVGGRVSPDRAWTLAAYVGYDDNRPMTRGRLRVAGASGALPAWMLTALGLAEAGLLGQPEKAQPQPLPEGLVRVPVADLSGLPVPGADPAREVLVLAPAHVPSRRFTLFGERPQETAGAVEALPEDYGLALDGEPEPPDAGDSGVDDPRLGAPPSIWDDIVQETE